MIITGSIFATHKIKKMFEAENYTKEEFYDLTKRGKPIQSRNNRRIMYILREGQIQIIEKR